MKIKKACEIVAELLAGYKDEYAESCRLADKAMKLYHINGFDFKDKLHYEHMHMDALVAHGKIKAAKEILTTLAELSNENHQERQADSGTAR